MPAEIKKNKAPTSEGFEFLYCILKKIAAFITNKNNSNAN